MYNFIFYCIYSQQKGKGKSDIFSRLNGKLIAGLTLGIHFLFVIAITKAIYYKTMQFHYSPFLDKGWLKVVALIVMAIPFLYYNKKRVEQLKEHYNNEYLSFSVLNAIKFILIMVLPLLVIIKLSSK